MSQISQDSLLDEVVPDTPPTRKTQLNGSDESTTPPKKLKKQKKRQLCEKTVKKDTIDVMRIYILRSSSLTEKDIGIEDKSEGDNDLETDAGPDSADELERASRDEAVKEAAERLKIIGDDVDARYGKKIAKAFESLLPPLLQATRYETFSTAIQNLSRTVFGDDPDINSLAFVFYLTRRYVEAANEAGQHVHECVNFGERYVMETYGEWIAGQGGLEPLLDQAEGPGTPIE